MNKIGPCPPGRKKINRYPAGYNKRKTMIMTTIQIKKKCFVINGAVVVSYCGHKLSGLKQQIYYLTGGQEPAMGPTGLKSRCWKGVFPPNVLRTVCSSAPPVAGGCQRSFTRGLIAPVPASVVTGPPPLPVEPPCASPGTIDVMALGAHWDKMG